MVCGLVRFTSMALVIEVKRTETVTELSIYDTNGGMQKKRGGKYGCGTEGKRAKVERGVSLREGGTHPEPMHSNILAMKPMY